MRNGQRAAGRDLFLKNRDDRPGTSQHVAETHRHEARRARGADGSHDFLGHALRRAHDIRWPHSLICRNQHETLDAKFLRNLRQIFRADHIIHHRFPRMKLLHRHVFVRGGMKHDVGSIPFENAPERVRIPNISQHADAFNPIEEFVRLHFNLEQVVFADI